MNAISYLIPFITIFGIFVGWLLNSLSRWFENKKGSNKIRNKVLYNLLEVHYQLRKTTMDFNGYMGVIGKSINEIFSPLKLEMRDIEQKLMPVVKQTLKDIISKELEELEITYKTSLLTLAEVDPNYSLLFAWTNICFSII